MSRVTASTRADATRTTTTGAGVVAASASIPAQRQEPPEPSPTPPQVPPSQVPPSGNSQGESRWESPWRPISEAALLLAEEYERRAMLFPGWREQLITLLAPRPGDTVIDVGCGPGLNFAALHAAVGPHGTIIGLEESPALLSVAAAQVACRRWDNVKLINAPAEAAHLPVRADAALFTTSHDVMASPAALTNIFTHLHPGAAVAAGGWKLPSSGWLWPLRALVTALQTPYVTDVTGFERPWQLLAEYLPQLQLTEVGFGAGYLAHSHCPAPVSPASPVVLAPSEGNYRDRTPNGDLGRFHGQLAGVLDPLAARCTGQPVPAVRALLATTWRKQFGGSLGEAVLSDCAHALAEGRPWIHTLWTGGW